MKDFIKQKLRENMGKKVSYCAVVLDEKGKNILASKVGNEIPEDWKPIMHHMTIGFGKSLEDLGLNEYEGQTVELVVEALGKSKMAIAVKVNGFKTLNNIPHITIAINANEGGKPVMSNDITNWENIKSFTITGIIKNVYF